MTYFEHLKLNWLVTFRAFKMGQPVMAMFHFLHGLIPCQVTEHERWGLHGPKYVQD
jgi:hypothetical protein